MPAVSRSDRTRQAVTTSRFPLRSSGPASSAMMPSRTNRWVISPMRISPGAAAAWRRAATFTASPTANAWLRFGSPARTGPVLTPIRT